MTDTPDRDDPVLVRPYVTTSADTTELDAVEPTWPDPDKGDTAVQPAVAEAAPEEPPARTERFGPHPALRLAIFGGGVVLALAVAGYLVFGPGNDPKLPQPGAALPAMPAQAPIPDSSAAAGSAAPSASVSASASASVSASASPSLSVSASQQVLQPVTPGATTPAASPSAEPTTTPPATDRTGAITAASGRCLARGGLFGIDGSPVQVANCSGSDAQTFTLTTSGTLQVDGKCAATTGDGSVRIGSCDNATSWRTGEGGSLVAGDGKCLTDPGRSGATTTVKECAGSDEQNWSLPG
jgi:hypothetical protein